MDIKVRNIRNGEEIKAILSVCRATSGTIEELAAHFARNFDESAGESRHIFTGFPDTVLLAESGGRIVGYLHFYTDCWDGYEKNLLSIGVDPSLDSTSAGLVQAALQKVYEMQEP